MFMLWTCNEIAVKKEKKSGKIGNKFCDRTGYEVEGWEQIGLCHRISLWKWEEPLKMTASVKRFCFSCGQQIFATFVYKIFKWNLY